MDRCPPEIIVKISRWACVDDGTTGRSLASVSHYVRQASSLTRFQSLALYASQISRFTSAIPQLRASLVPVDVHHLFLSLAPADKSTIQRMLRKLKPSQGRPTGQCDIDWACVDAASIPSPSKSIAVWDAHQARVHEQVPKIQGLVVNLLTQVGSTLRGLSIDQSYDFLDFVHLQVPLTNLRSLTISSLTSAFRHIQGASLPSEDTAKLCLPSLHTVHITKCYKLCEIWHLLAQLAPHNTLRRLRVSGMTQDPSMASFIRLHLDIPDLRRQSLYDDTSDIRTPSAKLNAPGASQFSEGAAGDERLKALRYVCVQPGTYKSGGWCGTGAIMHSQMVYLLEQLEKDAKNAETPCGRLLLLPDGWYTRQQAMADWLEENSNADGFWGPLANGGCQ